ncbi:hypothetical protein BH10PSE2_BH10PSE2_10740 [soil metagenome]
MSADDLALPLSNGGRVILASAGSRAERQDASGMCLWAVTPIDAADAFVTLEHLDGDIVLTTWRGVAYRIGLAEGAILSTTFVK